MRTGILPIFSLLLFIFMSSPHAEDIPLEFSDPAQEERFKDLVEEIRCLVCQNQSLADSRAELAQDLRQEIYRMVIAGDSNEDIVNYLVARYGDFVLYRPPLKPTTYLLWLGPVIFLVFAALFAITTIRKKKYTELSVKEQELASQLLSDNEEGSDQA
jgi:cytochrome c-type biogenesis protein CcmH